MDEPRRDNRINVLHSDEEEEDNLGVQHDVEGLVYKEDIKEIKDRYLRICAYPIEENVNTPMEEKVNLVSDICRTFVGHLSFGCPLDVQRLYCWINRCTQSTCNSWSNWNINVY